MSTRPGGYEGRKETGVRNHFFHVKATDRYGVTYFKNFTKWADGHVSMQYWTSKDTRIKTRPLK